MSRTYLAIEGAFDAEACDSIVALGAAAPDEAGPVWTQAAYGIDASARDVRSTLHEREASPWLFDRLDALFAQASAHFGIEVGPIGEPVQILRYQVGQHFLRWHSDAGFDRQGKRLLSMSVELSEPGDYQGGLLELVPDTVGRPRTLPRGSAQIFPSRALHRVTPVTAGVRWALVAWTGA